MEVLEALAALVAVEVSGTSEPDVAHPDMLYIQFAESVQRAVCTLVAVLDTSPASGTENTDMAEESVLDTFQGVHIPLEELQQGTLPLVGRNPAGVLHSTLV